MVNGCRDAEAETAIGEFNNRLLEAIRTGNLDAIAALTPENYMTIGDRRPAVVGKEANLAAYRFSIPRIDVDERWMPSETLVDSDIAYQRGRFEIQITYKGSGKEGMCSGELFNVYRCGPDGSWALTLNKFTTETGGEIWDELFA